MNSGIFGPPGAFKTGMTKTLSMTLDASHLATAYDGKGSAFHRAYDPTIGTVDAVTDKYLAGMSFQVVHSAGAPVVKMGMRRDGYFGLGGGSFGTWLWYVHLVTGNMVASGDITSYSDPRLKSSVAKINDPFSLLAGINGYTFVWNTDTPHTENRGGQRDYGLLSTEVIASMPEAVHSSMVIEGESYDTVAYTKLIPVLVECVKTLKDEVNVLRNEIKALRGY